MAFDWKPLALKAAPWVLTAVLGVGTIAIYNAKQQAIGQEKLLTAQWEKTAKDANKRADSLAKVYRVDTLRLTKLRTRWDTTFTHLTDTLSRTDTVRVPVKVLVLADSTIKACTQALSTCEQRVGVERQRGDAYQKENVILKARIPSAATPWVDRVIGGVVVGGIVYLVKR